MKYSFKCQLEKFTNSPLWNYYIPVPEEITIELIKTSKRVVVEINGKLQIQVALFPKAEGFHFINLNKEVRKMFDLEQGDEIAIKIWNDTSEYGIHVPEVFTELCYQDPEGDEVFHSLTKGKQRGLLHLIGKPKSEQKQLEKALIIFDYLKSVNGELDFKELNQAFKENNRFR